MQALPGGTTAFVDHVHACVCGHVDCVHMQSPERVDGIAYISPIMYPTGGMNQVRYGSTVVNTQVTGTTYSYQDVAQLYTKYGRFISESDDTTRRRVAVIGEDVRQDLDLPENPVGEFIKIGDDKIKRKLFETTDELIARGGFGTPTFFIDGGDMYFGNDRLELMQALTAKRKQA